MPGGIPSLLFLLHLLALSWQPASATAAPPTPAPWPEQFHALLYTNLSSTGKIRVDDLWYDWTNRRNLFMMQQQLSDLLYDVEWDNGTSFYYTLGDPGSCLTRHFPVGVLRPDFLQGSTYLGRVHADGFLCDLWQKLDFIWYYEDVATGRPVRWDFYDGISMHVITFEAGAVLEGSPWQAPAYCFDGDGEEEGGGSRSSAVVEEKGSMDVQRRLRFLDCQREATLSTFTS
ncbi:hypothetical protein Taro_014411 [Colocasia esculenta]|uniref:Uncharacterized protein n=1 Tax=Colocasia esculenta TaxID=4460 RepID=A0A843UEG4_COLES|nr:hypothetical protein [Colocasia esculenta]